MKYAILIFLLLIPMLPASAETLAFTSKPDAQYIIASNETLTLEWEVSSENYSLTSYKIYMIGNTTDLVVDSFVDDTGIISLSLFKLPPSVFNISTTIRYGEKTVTSIVSVVVLGLSNTDEASFNLYFFMVLIVIPIIKRYKTNKF